MLISGFVKLIKKAFDGFVNLLVMLLVKAGMWLPAVFSLAFILICLALGIKFTGFTTGVFLVGLIATAIIGAMLAFKHHMKLKRAVPSKNKVPYLDKSRSKSMKKSADYSSSEWDNSSKAQSDDRFVPDEDRVGRHNKDFAYKEPDPIYEEYNNSHNHHNNNYNNPPPVNNSRPYENRQYDSRKYGNHQNGNSLPKNPPVYNDYNQNQTPQSGKKGTTSFNQYFNNHESFNQHYNQINNDQGNQSNNPTQSYDYNDGQSNHYNNQYGSQIGFGQSNGFNNLNNGYYSPNTNPVNHNNQQPNGYYNQNQDNIKYEDFNDLKQRYFGNDNAKPSDEVAATYNNPNPQIGFNKSGFPQSQDGFPQSSFNPNNGFSQNGGISQPADRFPQTSFSQSSGGYNQPASNTQSPFDKFFERNNKNESPMVFATRRDPDIIIHEYPDRLEFYRKTANGLVLLSMERKQ